MSVISDLLLLKEKSNFKLTFFMKVLLILVVVPLLFLQSNSKWLEQIYFGISVSDFLILCMLMSIILVILFSQHKDKNEEGASKTFVLDTIKKFTELVKSEPSSKVTSRSHIRQVQESRDNEKESIHVLYATAGSISLYYSRATWEWVDKEEQHKVLGCRKRIIIVEKEAIGNIEFQNEIKRIEKRLSNTSELKVLFDVDINKHEVYQELIRDFGIFKNKENERKGFFTCSSFEEHKVFSQVPNNYYIIENINYLTNLENKFNQLWNDNEFKKLFNDRMERIQEIKSTDDYKWADSEAHLNINSLNSLHQNKIPAIRISEFATNKECDSLLVAIQKHYSKLKQTSKKKKKNSIGIGTFDRYKTPITKYESENSIYQQIVDEAGFNPIKRILQKLEEECDIVARIVCDEEEDYYAGVIRMVDNQVLIHVDLTPIDAEGFDMHNITNQIAWNLFLTTPQTGGECIVYNSPWTNDYSTCKVVNNSVICDREMVEEEKRFTIKPKKGDLVLFNCRNFHEVTAISERRITVGSFMGKDIDDNYLLWS